jgi:hypothetical protein
MPQVPGFEFSGRDSTDTSKAKQREKIVKFICDNNDLEYKNSRNERRLGIEGTAFWKVCWDDGAKFGADTGDVTVMCPRACEIYPDPSACDIDSCEYIGYVYRMHRQKASRVFENDFRSSGTSIDDYLGVYSMYPACDGLYDTDEDCVTITEWWFRQTSAGKLKVKVGKG